jgi:hypothetical protein
MVFFKPDTAGWFARYKDIEDGPYPTKLEAEEVLSAIQVQATLPKLKVVDPLLDSVEHWFTYQSPTPEQVKAMAEIRQAAKCLASLMVTHCPPSPDRTTAIRKLREAVMTANASIVLGGK